MSRPKHPKAPTKNCKLTRTHQTLIDFAQELRQWAETEDTVTKIVAGIIRRTKSSANTYKVTRESGCVKVTTKTQSNIQEVRFYVSDVVEFNKKLCEYAEQRNIRVVHA